MSTALDFGELLKRERRSASKHKTLSSKGPDLLKSSEGRIAEPRLSADYLCLERPLFRQRHAANDPEHVASAAEYSTEILYLPNYISAEEATTLSLELESGNEASNVIVATTRPDSDTIRGEKGLKYGSTLIKQIGLDDGRKVFHERDEADLAQDGASKSCKWIQLAHRRLKNLGGVPHRNGMIKEELPDFAQKLADKLVADQIFDHQSDRAPNQLLINEYTNGAGIGPHRDGDLYYPKAAILSLRGTRVLEFYEKIDNSKSYSLNSMSCPALNLKEGSRHHIGEVLGNFRVVARYCLQPRSLLVFFGDAYNRYYHGIRKLESEVQESFDDCQNISICRQVSPIVDKDLGTTSTEMSNTCPLRLSVTIRHAITAKERKDRSFVDSEGLALCTSAAAQEQRRRLAQWVKGISEDAPSN